MKRRQFLGLVGAVAAWPVAAHAQQTQMRRRRLGLLLIGTPESRSAQTVAYARWLEQKGWKNGVNLDVEYRWAVGDPEHLRHQAADIANLAPDVILVESAAGLAAVRQMAPSIPVVFVMVGDPVGSGFVNSLAHPGGTITGFTNFEPSMGGKWLEVLKEAAPSVNTVAVLLDPRQSSHGNYWNSAEVASRVLGTPLTKMEMRRAEDIERALEKLPTGVEQGLMVLPHLITASNRKTIIDFAAKHRIPAVYGVRFFAKDGGLISYGVDSQDLFRGAFGYIDRILKGDKPMDLPVQAPTKFELVVNFKTAKELGLTVAPTLLARADEVIE
jgi:putative ABC transport system substrate-binding protein